MSRFDNLERVATEVVDCGFQIHKDLGPGLLESAYEKLMAAELGRRGIGVAQQVPINMSY